MLLCYDIDTILSQIQDKVSSPLVSMGGNVLKSRTRGKAKEAEKEGKQVLKLRLQPQPGFGARAAASASPILLTVYFILYYFQENYKMK